MKFLLYFSLFFLISCQKSHKLTGYAKISNVENNLKIGDKIDEIIEKHGPPSIVDENVYYYIKIDGKEGSVKYFMPKKITTIKIEFKNDIVLKIEKKEKNVS